MSAAPLANGHSVTWGPLTLDTETCVLSANGKAVRLPPREASVLAVMFRLAKPTDDDTVLRTKRVIDVIRDEGGGKSPETLRIYIHKIRRRLSDLDVPTVCIQGFKGGYILSRPGERAS